MNEKYICRPASHVIKEITKRGKFNQRKDDETGEVVKKKNEYGPNSMFGWGAQDATIPTLKKDLEDLRKDLPNILDQIKPFQKKSRKIAQPIQEEVEEPQPLLNSWYQLYTKEQAPSDPSYPLAVVKHFCGFFKSLF